jgi:hypothetical protein
MGKAVDMHREYRIAVIIILGMMSVSTAKEPREAPMTFSLHRACDGNASFCGPYILAQGTITASTPAQFQDFISRVKFKPTIYFDSVGGNLAAGIQMGYFIRRAKLDTFVGGPYEKVVKDGQPYKTLVRNGMCFSACAYAFLGGVVRELNEGGRYGVHQFYGAKKDVGESSAQHTMAVLARYTDEMGVSRQLLDLASLTYAAEIQVIPLNLARDLNIDNTVPPKSSWEIKATERGDLSISTLQRQARRDAIISFSIWREKILFIGSLYYRIRQNFRSPSEMEEAFKDSSSLEFVVNGRRVVIEAPSPWAKAPDGLGYMIQFVLPPALLAEIASADAFEIRANWPHALIDIEPSTEFGTVGFRSGLVAISRRTGHGS